LSLAAFPAHFNGVSRLGFVTAPTSLGSTEVNQTLHNVWPSPGLVRYIYISGGSYPATEFCQVQNSLCVQLLRSPRSSAMQRYCTALEQSASSKLCGVEWNYRTFAPHHFQQRTSPIFGGRPARCT